jgi:lipoyl(octanoyl) transferase
VLTVGRAGSRRHVRCPATDLQRRGISVQWVERGGGCILHNVGQLAVYPIAHLGRLGITLGRWTCLLRDALLRVLQDLCIDGAPRHGHCGLVGRSGQLAAAGFAVRGGVCRFGAYLNVNPPLDHYRRIDVIDPDQAAANERTTMGSLVCETGRPVTMSAVRSSLVHHLSAAFGCEDRYKVSHACPAPPRFV